MELHEFYVISEENEEPKNNFIIRHLGNEVSRAAFGKSVHNGFGFKTITDFASPTPITDNDYNEEFCYKLLSINPPYEIDKFLDYHFKNYIKSKQADKLKFCNHIKYVILPKLARRENQKFMLNWLQNG
jgi:hypothetical protein